MDIKINVNADTKKASSALSALGKTINGTGASYAGFYAKTKKMNESFSSITKDANRASETMKGFGNSLNTLKIAGKIALLVQLAHAMFFFTKSSMDAIETVNLFSVSLGTMAEESDDTLESMSNLAGLDLTNLRSAVGTFALLARSMGMTDTQARVLGENTAKLAIDLSSLTNVPLNQVMADLRSGLVGQSETVYKYGLDVTEAGLKQEAMRQGIQKSVRDMSQGEKMALRYAVMIRQSSLAHGDFAKTLDTPANQLRILKERFVTLARSIGNIFIPALTIILPYLNAIVKALIQFANFIAKLFGFKPIDVKNTKNAVGAMGELGDETAGAGKELDKATGKAKKLQNALMGIDEINLLPKQPDADTGGGAGGGGGAGMGDSILEDMDLLSYDNLFGDIRSKSDEIYESMMKWKYPIAEFIARLQMAGTTLWEKLKAPLELVGESLGEVMSDIGETILSAFSDLGSLSTPIYQLFYDNIIPLLQNFVVIVGEILYGLLDVVNVILGDLWNSVIYPVVANLIEVALPVILGFVDETIKTISTLFVEVKKLFLLLWTEGVKPALDFIVKMWLDVVDVMSNFWNNYGVPIMDGLRETFRNVSEVLVNLWETLLKPMWDTFMETLDVLWTNHIKPLADNFMDFVGVLIICALDIINKVILPLIQWFAEKLTPVLKNLFKFWMDGFVVVYGTIADVVSGIITVLKGIIQFITGVFTGNWTQVWQGVVNIFKGIFQGMQGILKGVINGIIGLLNFGIGGIEGFLNGVISKLNKLVSAMSAVKELFGGSSIPSIGQVYIPRIPMLARGGQLESGSLFQAGEFGKAEMIGSYQGQTTVMPLEDTDFVGAMYDAVAKAITDAMPKPTDGDSGDIILQVGSTELGRIAIDSINKVTKQDGRLSLNI